MAWTAAAGLFFLPAAGEARAPPRGGLHRSRTISRRPIMQKVRLDTPLGGRQAALGRSHFNGFSFRECPGCLLSPFPHGTCALSVSSSIFRAGGWDPLLSFAPRCLAGVLLTYGSGRPGVPGPRPRPYRGGGGGRYCPPKPTSAQRFPPTGAFTHYGQRGTPPKGASAFPSVVHSRTLGVSLVGDCGEHGNARRNLSQGRAGPQWWSAPPERPPALTGTSPGPLSLATTGGISLDLFTSPY